MITLTKEIKVEFLEWNELTAREKQLIVTAELARRNAQAPYSNYHVGAALLDGDGRINVGCNVERATYTQTTHAEQAAIDAMVVSGHSRKIVVMAIVGGPKGKMFEFPLELKPNAKAEWNDVCPSCGHCLQIILENSMGYKGVVLLQPLSSGFIARTTIGDALPMRFGPSHLGIDISKS